MTAARPMTCSPGVAQQCGPLSVSTISVIAAPTSRLLRINRHLLALLITIFLSASAIAGSDPLASNQPLGPTRVTLTIDDFPLGTGVFPLEMTREKATKQIIKTLKANGVIHPYGFSNGSFMEGDPSEKRILKMWLAAEHLLGNHTYDHSDLSKVGVKAFIQSIAEQDQLLATLDKSPGAVRRRRVFRYPFVEEGNTLVERNAVRKYLSENGYRIAEVTTDYFDWEWNAAFNRCTSQQDEKSIAWLKSHIADSADRHLRRTNLASERLFDRRIPQIVLIHLNVFNAITLGPILKHWKDEGVQFVSLDETLADPVYRFDPKGAYEGGMTFLDQIAESHGVHLEDFDDHIYTPARLNEVCKAPSADRQ